MQSTSNSLPELLARARAGDQESCGWLLEKYREYLRIIARSKVGRELQVRLDPSDLVQESLLEAQRDFRQFLGDTDAELAVWLRRILVRNLVDQLKRNRCLKRDFGREESLETCDQVSEALASPLSTPSAHAARCEQERLLDRALGKLPATYRQVITLRNVEGLDFSDIAAEMGRTSGAVRMLWMRALEQLGSLMEAGHEPQ